MTVMRRGQSWSFVVWVRTGDGVTRARRQVARGGYRTKWDAVAAERRFLVELEDSAQEGDAVAGPTVAEFLGEWLVSSRPTRRPTTSVSYERCVRDHVVPHLGEVRLPELAPDHVRAWQAALLRTPRRFRDGPLSPTTVRYCHRLLRRALQDALRWGLIDRNPCDAVDAPRPADTEMSVWSPPEVRRFLAFVDDDRLAAMWRLFLATGMRRGEIAGLRWIDLDLEHGRLSVQHTRVLVYDRRPGVGTEDETVAPRHRARRRHGRRAAGAPRAAGRRAGVGPRRVGRLGLRVRARRRRAARPGSDQSPVPRARPDGEVCRRSVCTTCATRRHPWRSRPASTRRSCPSGSVTRRSRSRSTPTATSRPDCKKMPPIASAQSSTRTSPTRGQT